jgi:hypothetical protein
MGFCPCADFTSCGGGWLHTVVELVKIFLVNKNPPLGPEIHESRLQPRSCSFNINLNIILPLTIPSPPEVSSHQIFRLKFRMHVSSFLLHAIYPAHIIFNSFAMLNFGLRTQNNIYRMTVTSNKHQCYTPG